MKPCLIRMLQTPVDKMAKNVLFIVLLILSSLRPSNGEFYVFTSVRSFICSFACLPVNKITGKTAERIFMEHSW